MRIKLIPVLLILIPFTGIRSQIPIIVVDDSVRTGKNLLPGLSVNIPEADFDKTLNLWKKELQTGTKSKVVTENNELSIFGAILKNISPDPLNVYSKMVRQDSMLRLSVSLEIKKDVYIERSTRVVEYLKMKDYLKQFAKDQYIDVAKAQSDAEDKKLYKLQRDLASIEDEKSRLQKSIESNKSLILSDKENITFQTNELNTAEKALDEQNDLFAKMEEGPAKKEKSAQIKDLEKRKGKALSSIGTSESRIKKANNAIDKAINEIPVNDQKQEKAREQVNVQEDIALKYAARLKKIREY